MEIRWKTYRKPSKTHIILINFEQPSRLPVPGELKNDPDPDEEIVRQTDHPHAFVTALQIDLDASS